MEKVTQTPVHARAFLKVTVAVFLEKRPKSKASTRIMKQIKMPKNRNSELMIQKRKYAKNQSVLIHLRCNSCPPDSSVIVYTPGDKF